MQMVKQAIHKAMHDACYRQVKARYNVFPSARASQAIAKCRKSHGHVRHGQAGSNLKRWQNEKWKTTHNKPCGAKSEHGGYCRPTHKVSNKTPKLKKSLSKSQLKSKQAEKRKVGPGHRVSKA